MQERIIVSFTTYHRRIQNIPVVLDTIFQQTQKPDLVVMNLAFDEVIPDAVQAYIDSHPIEVNRVPDTKVYKKILPTLKQYPHDCIISIDDDFLYPQGMIADFMTIHRQYPNHPVSGNRMTLFGMPCHCGCASLIKADYLGDAIDCIDADVIAHCPSDDLVYTYMANQNGCPYVRTQGLYFLNMPAYQEGKSYSQATSESVGVYDTYHYLVQRFGPVSNNLHRYINDPTIVDIMNDINDSFLKMGRVEGAEETHQTLSYRIGHVLLWPFKYLRHACRRRHTGV